jgi:hypothetical protein
MSRRIPLTLGQEAIVDDCDYDWLSAWKWQANWQQNIQSFYAVHAFRKNGKSGSISMARLIMGVLPGFFIDHRNHNTLDNRRSNLRICTREENTRNRGLHSNSVSGVIGVRWRRDMSKWQARIQINQKQQVIGYFDSLIAATAARDAAAIRLHKEFAYLNRRRRIDSRKESV